MSVILTDEQRAELRKEQAALNVPHLRKKLYAFLWTKAPETTDDDMLALLPAHVRFLHGLEDAGVLFASGPLSDGDDVPYRGSGLTVVRAESFTDAKALMDPEPFVKAGLRTFTLHKWILNEGHVGVSLNFASGKFEVH